jgi:hypothetical protein
MLLHSMDVQSNPRHIYSALNSHQNMLVRTLIPSITSKALYFTLEQAPMVSSAISITSTKGMR